MNNTVKFFHRQEYVYPYTCAFYEENGRLHFAVARCHDNDNFDKRKGRTIAESRLTCHRAGIKLRNSVALETLNKYNEKINMHSIIEYVDGYVANNAAWGNVQ
jgi:hypothetical protein